MLVYPIHPLQKKKDKDLVVRENEFLIFYNERKHYLFALQEWSNI